MMSVTKINSSVTRQAVLARQYNIVVRASPISALHTSSIQQKGIVERAKDIGHEVNMKVGQGLAQGLESAESVAHKAPSAKGVGEKLRKVGQDTNKKMGQGLAQGIEGAESVANKVPNPKDLSEKVRNAGQEANLKAGKFLSHKIEDAESVAGKTLGGRDLGEKVKNMEQEVTKMAGQSIDHISSAARKTNANDVKKAGKEIVSKGAEKMEEAVDDAIDKFNSKGKN